MGAVVAVAGASGYAGGELLRLLSGHPDVTLAALGAGTSAGQPVRSVHPQLAAFGDRVFSETKPELLSAADAVLLALPHGTSAALEKLLPRSITVVDLGADFRLSSAASWGQYYGGVYAGAWPYGLPELPGQRDRLRGVQRIAVPGCHATAAELALAPLLAARLIDPLDISIVSVTGTSGGGRTTKESFTSAQVMGDVVAYKVGNHQHTAEIVQTLSAAAGTAATISFAPVLAPMPRGILATATARTTASESELRAVLAQAYGEEPFVHLLPAGVQPHTGSTLGSNSCQVQLVLDDSAGRVIVTSALDNLVKGAAGQAIQCLNLALGLPETMGLTANGVAP